MIRHAIVLCALAASTAATANWRCTDEKGVTHMGDTPPAACARVPVHEISPSGLVKRTLQPSLTPEQAAAKKEREEQLKKDMKNAVEQSRRDQALLATYSSVKEIDLMLESNLKPIQKRLDASREKLAGLEKKREGLATRLQELLEGTPESKRNKLSEDMRVREAPIRAELSSVNSEIKAVNAAIASLEADAERLRAKYGADRTRYAELRP